MKTNHFLKTAVAGCALALSIMSLNAVAYYHTQSYSHTCVYGNCQTHKRTTTCANGACYHTSANRYYQR